MGKIAFLFPGQGAQFVGMGKDFYENFPESRAIYEEASDRIGLDMKKICFEENDQIHMTEFTQAAILTTSIAMLEVWKKEAPLADVCAGLSLGEYSALVACGAMRFEDAVHVVRERGILMQEAVPIGKGTMTAVLGMEKEKVEEVLSSLLGVQIANYNCPGQIVISGRTASVAEAVEKLKEAGAKRCLPLKVSGPFHSDMLFEAGEQLAKVLEPVEFFEHSIPYVTNVTAEYVSGTAEIKDLLRRQVSSSVRWQQSVERMIKDGVDRFIEIGPGKTLSGFVKKINREVSVSNIGTIEDLKRTTCLNDTGEREITGEHGMTERK